MLCLIYGSKERFPQHRGLQNGVMQGVCKLPRVRQARGVRYHTLRIADSSKLTALEHGSIVVLVLDDTSGV